MCMTVNQRWDSRIVCALLDCHKVFYEGGCALVRPVPSQEADWIAACASHLSLGAVARAGQPYNILSNAS